LIGTSATSGDDNVAIGRSAGKAVTTGIRNIGIGLNAGLLVNTGSTNIAIGFGAGDAVTSQDNTINIGCNVDNTTAATTCIGGGCVMATQFTATSDCRSKCKIKTFLTD
jgi:hypothetical protein